MFPRRDPRPGFAHQPKHEAASAKPLTEAHLKGGLPAIKKGRRSAERRTNHAPHRHSFSLPRLRGRVGRGARARATEQVGAEQAQTVCFGRARLSALTQAVLARTSERSSSAQAVLHAIDKQRERYPRRRRAYLNPGSNRDAKRSFSTAGAAKRLVDTKRSALPAEFLRTDAAQTAASDHERGRRHGAARGAIRGSAEKTDFACHRASHRPTRRLHEARPAERRSARRARAKGNCDIWGTGDKALIERLKLGPVGPDEFISYRPTARRRLRFCAVRSISTEWTRSLPSGVPPTWRASVRPTRSRK